MYNLPRPREVSAATLKPAISSKQASKHERKQSDYAKAGDDNEDKWTSSF